MSSQDCQIVNWVLVKRARKGRRGRFGMAHMALKGLLRGVALGRSSRGALRVLRGYVKGCSGALLRVRSCIPLSYVRNCPKL